MTALKTQSKFSKFLISIVISFAPGIIGIFFTYDAIPTWYAGLDKPFFSPPNWIFGPVWSLLYLLMGVSFFIIWTAKQKESKKTDAYLLFFIQLILNTLWSIVFFGIKSPLLALIEIVILWVSIFLTIISFNKIARIAGYLLWPYLAWVTFATLLTLAIVWLN
jgi:translocator protein